MDSKRKISSGAAVSLENLPMSTAEVEKDMNKQALSSSSTTLSDSGCPQSPDDADLVNSPPALSRCVTDSPSNYFLRGGQHRWSSTPLLKAPSRSLSIPVSCTPLAKLPGTLTYSPPKASSTPETNGNKGQVVGAGVSPFSPGFNSLDSLSAVSSLTNINISNNSNHKISSLAQLSPQEFTERIQAFQDNETLPLSDSLHKANPESNNHGDINQSNENSVKLEGNSSSNHESDSGIGSSHHETSSETSAIVESPPKRTKSRNGQTTAILPKLRRSPRSLAIQNRIDRMSSRAKLVESPSSKVKLRTTSYMRSPGYYSDWDRMDIFVQLRKLNMSHVLDLIFSYLRPEDLCRVAVVSSEWNKLLQDNIFEEHNTRRTTHVAEVMRNRENYGRAVTITRSSPRIALKEVKRNISPQNKRNRESSNSAPSVISPSKIRNRLFTEEKSEIFERPVRYLHCPHCSATSKVKSVQGKDGSCYEVAECGSKTCNLVFCVKCLYIDHKGGACQIPQLTRSKSAVVTSKKSKARLRRL